MDLGGLEQIQFLLGHASVQATKRYIGYAQKRRSLETRSMIGLESRSKTRQPKKS